VDTGDQKRPYDIDEMLNHIRDAVRPYPKAALFELRDDGYDTPFQQLVACLISIRTRDEQTLPIARALFERASTAAEVAALGPERIDGLIRESAFHEPKSRQIHGIALKVSTEWGGDLPCDFETLTSFPGVGPKCANLALGIACGQARIGVDIHVHRISNRWGYITASTPEKTMLALEKRLPSQHWLTINELLVPFGKHICTGVLPKCSTCPVLEYCQQIGVTRHR
jgi:endonuclease-3